MDYDSDSGLFKMITYNDLYEALRKEKYSDQLQPLLKGFVQEVADYIKDKEALIGKETDLFSDSAKKAKKQLENAVSIFKELILRRKKKLLDLAFVSAETGISKRDFENMLASEKEAFEEVMKALDKADKKVEKILTGVKEEEKEKNKMVMFKQDTDEFLDTKGEKLGPFKQGDIVNIPLEIANILIVDDKAEPVEEE